MLVFRRIHQWLVDRYQERGYQLTFMTREESGNVLVHDACTYMWRDIMDTETNKAQRQGLTIGYGESKVTYGLWYLLGPKVFSETGIPSGMAPLKEIYLADPDLFDAISKVIALYEPNL